MERVDIQSSFSSVHVFGGRNRKTKRKLKKGTAQISLGSQPQGRTPLASSCVAFAEWKRGKKMGNTKKNKKGAKEFNCGSE